MLANSGKYTLQLTLCQAPATQVQRRQELVDELGKPAYFDWEYWGDADVLNLFVKGFFEDLVQEVDKFAKVKGVSVEEPPRIQREQAQVLLEITFGPYIPKQPM